MESEGKVHVSGGLLTITPPLSALVTPGSTKRAGLSPLLLSAHATVALPIRIMHVHHDLHVALTYLFAI